jgi:hypothetical protein
MLADALATPKEQILFLPILSGQVGQLHALQYKWKDMPEPMESQHSAYDLPHGMMTSENHVRPQRPQE